MRRPSWWPVAALSLLACGGPAVAPKPAAAPSPTTVAVAPAPLESPAVVAPAPSQPLPRHLLLPDAGALVVVEVSALRELGLRDTLRLLARDELGADALPCVEPLLEQASRIITTSSLRHGGSATVVEQSLPVEPLLDCLAKRVPDAAAKPIGNRAGLEIRPGTIAIDIDGTLVVGNEPGLSSLLGARWPPPGELRRGDVLDESFDPPPPLGPEALIEQLPAGSGKALMRVAQQLGFGAPSAGTMRASARLVDDGLQVEAVMVGIVEQLQMFQRAGPEQDDIVERVLGEAVRSLRQSLTDRVDADRAAPLLAALDDLQIERTGPDIRLGIDVRDPTSVVQAAEHLSRIELSRDDEPPLVEPAQAAP